MPAGLPSGWEGTNFEVYGLPTGADSTVAFAVRWHGARPAVLWEQTGGPVTLQASTLAPDWATAEVKRSERRSGGGGGGGGSGSDDAAGRAAGGGR